MLQPASSRQSSINADADVAIEPPTTSLSGTDPLAAELSAADDLTLATLDQLPLRDQVEAYERLHTRIRQTLEQID